MSATAKSKLLLAGILLLLGLVFALQNSTVVEVKVLFWSLEMSQALVIFLTGVTGGLIGFFFGTAFRFRRPH